MRQWLHCYVCLRQHYLNYENLFVAYTPIFYGVFLIEYKGNPDGYYNVLLYSFIFKTWNYCFK